MITVTSYTDGASPAQKEDLRYMTNIFDQVFKLIKWDGQISGMVLSHTPTHNCQLFCMSAFNSLITKVFANQNTMDGRNKLMRGCLERLKQGANGKRLLLVDINDAYVARVNELSVLKDRIKIHTPYISTNTSRMNIILFDLSDI